MTIFNYRGQIFESTRERIKEIRLGAVLPFTIYTEKAAKARGHKFKMSEHRARKLAFVESQGGKCLVCSTVFELTIDHVIPVSQLGTFVPNNLQILCRYCNREKDNKIIDYRPQGQQPLTWELKKMT